MQETWFSINIIFMKNNININNYIYINNLYYNKKKK